MRSPQRFQRWQSTGWTGREVTDPQFAARDGDHPQDNPYAQQRPGIRFPRKNFPAHERQGRKGTPL
eukprot:scaffold942_cov260-Pinguiococcus_pyrenoidosus.AAC.5